MLRKEYLLELLQGEPSTVESRSLRFDELNIPLQADCPIWIVAGRVDGWREGIGQGDKSLFLYAINNIFEQFFSEMFQSVYLVHLNDRFVWLLQPKAEIEQKVVPELERETTFALGTLESVQSACRQYLKLVCSFIVSSKPYTWEQLHANFERLNGLFLRGLGIGSEILLSDRYLFDSNKPRNNASLKKIHLLGQYLDQKDREKFDLLLDELTGTVIERSTIQAGYALELFYQLTATFISSLNRLDLLQTIAEVININQLFDMNEHKSWDEVTTFFRILADLIFTRREDENERETNEVVLRIHEYAQLHLDGDLSLTKLSDVVHLTPYYLSRLYKQKTGTNLTDYITTARINKAKELLCQNELKIHEVGMRVGYDSASYFGRFFKNITEMTPQQFRDSLK